MRKTRAFYQPPAEAFRRMQQIAYRSAEFEARQILADADVVDPDLVFSALRSRKRKPLRLRDDIVWLGNTPSEVLTEAFWDAPLAVTQAAKTMGMAIAYSIDNSTDA